jgi:transposase
MISVPAGVQVWLASGATDMRRGMNSLALQVQQALGRNPHGGDVFVFRGKRGDLLKVLWADGIGLSLYLKRLERGRFIWPAPIGGVVPITGAQLAYMLDGIDWRLPQYTWRPQAAG